MPTDISCRPRVPLARLPWDETRDEYLATVTWSAGAPLTLLLQNREQTHERLVAADPTGSRVKTLLEEQDEAWLELYGGTPAWLPDGRAFLWISERSGFAQLELREASGGLKQVLTPPELGLQRFIGYLPESAEALVEASADPRETHLYAVPLDPRRGGPRALTQGRGTHRAAPQDAGPLHLLTRETPDGTIRFEDGFGHAHGLVGRKALDSVDDDASGVAVEGVHFLRPVEGERRHAPVDLGQDGRRHGPHHIRKTPNFVWPIGWFIAAESPSASAMRVSAGSRMPSSHSRAVA